MGLKSTCSRRAFSTVLSALIISAVVLAVGGGIWAYSQGAMTITAEDYAEAMINMTETISERFIVEQVFYDPVADILHVWIFNYGSVDIEVNVTCPENANGWKTVLSKDLEEIVIGLDVSSGTELGIKVESRRENDAYYRFFVP